MARETIKSSRDNDRARSATSARTVAGNQRAASGRASDAAAAAATANAASRSSPAADRERGIETGHETGQRPSSAQQRDRERVPAIRQYASAMSASPFTLMRRMAEDMDRIFQDFGLAQPVAPAIGSAAAARDPWRQSHTLSQTWAPAIETFRRGDKLIVRADLPGLNREQVKVEVEGDQLSISGERNEEREENRDDYYRTERSYGRFYRAIPLPEGVRPDDCQASFRDGVLEVTLAAPREHAGSRREIRVT